MKIHKFYFQDIREEINGRYFGIFYNKSEPIPYPNFHIAQRHFKPSEMVFTYFLRHFVNSKAIYYKYSTYLFVTFSFFF